ncbi:MAG: AraC family transcriptional regulator [Oscillospiraceae bacterium]|nr:AraC family transcriptional regulator [Oscillospiraceae bacterium]
MNCFYTNTSEPLQYLFCGNLMSKDGFIHTRRTMNCNVLIFVLEGILHITQSNAAHSVSRGQYIFLKSGEEHYGHKPSDGNLSYLWVHFSTGSTWSKISLESKNDLPPEISFILPEHGTAESFQRITMLFRQLIDFSRHEALYNSSMLSYALALLIMELVQEFIDGMQNRQNNISPIIYTVMEWIKSNCHRQLSLNEIAKEFHYNAKYLSSLFKKETGISLMHYLNKSRIEISKNLLSTNDISIKEAAYSSGFHDEKYYMKIFKNQEGLTPLQYKNAFHKKYIN